MSADQRNGEGNSDRDSKGPLDQLTVLDLSRVLAGPFCSMQLGDMGADVIKVEQPGVGDQTRTYTPPTFEGSELSAYYCSVNRNKRSITINLATDEGQSLIKELAEDADVLIENFRIGKMNQWGIDYDSIAEINPDIIYCSISGYGQSGPKGNRPAYDLIIQAESGLMSITGEQGGPPVRVGVAVADLCAGMYASQSILSAIIDREIGTENGQYIDVSLLDSHVAWMTYMATNYFATGTPPGRLGSRHPTIAPYQAFEASDDYVIVGAPSEKIWTSLCEALETPELANDERFATNERRVENRELLEDRLGAIFSTYEAEEVAKLLQHHEVPVTTIQNMHDVFESEHIQERGMRATIDHPAGGTIEMPGIPMQFSRSNLEIHSAPPTLGEHTEELLKELGYADQEIQSLRERHII